MEYLEITGNHCAAKILSIFEFWTNKLKQMGKVREWIYKSIARLQEELMGEHGINTIRNAVSILAEKGFIEKRHNPHIKYDRTYQYRLNVEKVQEALHSLIYQDEQMDLPQEKDEFIDTEESICPDSENNNIEVNIDNNSYIPTQNQEINKLNKEELTSYVANQLNIPVQKAGVRLYMWAVEWRCKPEFRNTVRKELKAINLTPDVLDCT